MYQFPSYVPVATIAHSLVLPSVPLPSIPVDFLSPQSDFSLALAIVPIVFAITGFIALLLATEKRSAAPARTTVERRENDDLRQAA
jgi:hypothetical protein